MLETDGAHDAYSKFIDNCKSIQKLNLKQTTYNCYDLLLFRLFIFIYRYSNYIYQIIYDINQLIQYDRPENLTKPAWSES